MAFTEDEASALVAATTTTASLSLIGSASIVLSFIAMPRVRAATTSRIIMMLAVADTFSSLSYLLHEPTPFEVQTPPYSASCLLAAGMSQFFDLSTFFWTVAVSVAVYLVIVQRAPALTMHKFERAAHAVAWGVPLLTLIIAAATGSFGDAGTWCWITSEFTALRMVLFYVPLMLCIAAVGVVVFFVWRRIGSVAGLKPEQKPAVVRRMATFFAAFAVMRMFSIINRLQQAATNEASPIFALALLHSIFSPLQGLANTLVYGLNRLVLTEWAHLCARCRGLDVQTGHGEGSSSGRGAGGGVAGAGAIVSLQPTNELEAMELDDVIMVNPIRQSEEAASASSSSSVAHHSTSPIAAQLFGQPSNRFLASSRVVANPIDDSDDDES